MSSSAKSRPSTPPTANWKTNSRSAINPFTTNSSTSNWPSPLRWSVIPPDASHPSSARPCGPRCPRSCPVTASSFSTATISRLRNIGLRNYARRGQPFAGPRPGGPRPRTHDGHRRVAVRGRPRHGRTRLVGAAVYPLVRAGEVGGGPQLLHFGIARDYLGSAAASSSCASTATSRVSCWANGDRRAAVRRAGCMSNACGCEAKRGK